MQVFYNFLRKIARAGMLLINALPSPRQRHVASHRRAFAHLQ
jgi:hypothetical protein